MRRLRRRHAGFTLVEVMIALSILFAALVVLLRGAAINISATQRAQMLTAATELARGKMYDIEEILLDEGFQELERSFEGDFDEEGWPTIAWKADVKKIELPNLQAMQSLGGEGEEGAEGAEGAEAESGSGGILDSFLGAGGGLGGEDGGAGAGFIGSQFEIFRNILETSIRKVTLTLSWRFGNQTEELVVDCYFTDPAAVNRVISGGGAQPGGEEGDDGDGEGDDAGKGGTTRGGSTGRGSTRGGSRGGGR